MSNAKHAAESAKKATVKKAALATAVAAATMLTGANAAIAAPAAAQNCAPNKDDVKAQQQKQNALENAEKSLASAKAAYDAAKDARVKNAQKIQDLNNQISSLNDKRADLQKAHQGLVNGDVNASHAFFDAQSARRANAQKINDLAGQIAEKQSQRGDAQKKQPELVAAETKAKKSLDETTTAVQNLLDAKSDADKATNRAHETELTYQHRQADADRAAKASSDAAEKTAKLAEAYSQSILDAKDAETAAKKANADSDQAKADWQDTKKDATNKFNAAVDANNASKAAQDKAQQYAEAYRNSIFAAKEAQTKANQAEAQRPTADQLSKAQQLADKADHSVTGQQRILDQANAHLANVNAAVTKAQHALNAAKEQLKADTAAAAAANSQRDADLNTFNKIASAWRHGNAPLSDVSAAQKKYYGSRDAATKAANKVTADNTAIATNQTALNNVQGWVAPAQTAVNDAQSKLNALTPVKTARDQELADLQAKNKAADDAETAAKKAKADSDQAKADWQDTKKDATNKFNAAVDANNASKAAQDKAQQYAEAYSKSISAAKDAETAAKKAKADSDNAYQTWQAAKAISDGKYTTALRRADDAKNAKKAYTDAKAADQTAAESLKWLIEGYGDSYSAYMPDDYDSVLQTVQSQRDDDQAAYADAQNTRRANAKKIQDLAKQAADLTAQRAALQQNHPALINDETAKNAAWKQAQQDRSNNAQKIQDLAKQAADLFATRSDAQSKHQNLVDADVNASKVLKDATAAVAAAKAVAKAATVREDCVVPGTKQAANKVVVKTNAAKSEKGGLAETGANSIAAAITAAVLLGTGAGLAVARRRNN